MNRAHIAAARVSKFRRGAPSLEALAIEAAGDLAPDADALFVGNHAAEKFGAAGSLAPRIAEALGLHGVPAVRVECGTGSGAAAFFAAVDAVEAGRCERALVVGVERMTHVTTEDALAIVASMLSDEEQALGATPAALAALLASRAMHEDGLTREALADVPVWAHEAALANPNAQFHKKITRADVLASPALCEPLRLLDAAPLTDGAAAVLVTRDGPIRVAATASASARLSLTDRAPLTRLHGFASTRRAATDAYRRAGWAPSDVDIAEIHDAFSILTLTTLEDLGITPTTHAHAWLAENRRRINPSGGLKARGHPAGATGVAQLVECFDQLTGKAGTRQVAGARRALAQNVSGFGTGAFVTLLEARS